MSDSQPAYSRDWYTAMQRKHAAEIRDMRSEVEERVRAILDTKDALTAQSLLHQLIALDPLQALELLLAGGHD